MRKSAKILALLLTFVMLLGVVVTTAFANDDKAAAVHPNLTVSGEGITASEKIGNFEGSSYQGGVPYEMAGNTVKGSAAPLSPSYSIAGAWPRFLGAAKTVDVKVGGETVNTYMRLYHDLAEYPETNVDASGNWIGYNKDGKSDAITSWSLASGYSDVGTNYQDLKKHSLIVNDYIVVDFDFMADMYKNRETKELVDAIPEGADPTDYTLSYYSSIGLCLRSNGTGIQTPSYLSFVEEDGVWYVYNTLSKATKLPLQQTPGVWNHFTVVYDIDNRVDYTYKDPETQGDVNVTAGKLAECIERGGVITSTYLTESKLYVYLDGKLLANVPMISNTAANKEESLELTIDEYRISAPSTGSDGWKNTYSFAFDNMAAYFYAEGYQGDLATAYAADNVPETLGAYADMVYNYNYQYSAPNAPVASIAVGDTVKNYYATEFALANIEEGCTLTLLGDAKVENYVAFCNFTVVCDEGEFSLAQCEKVANRTTSGYEVTDASDNQKFTVLYYPSFDDAENSENEIVMEGNQNTATVDQPIFIPDLPGGTLGNITADGVEYKLLTKWQLYYYVDEEEVEIIDLTPETVIDAAKLAVINKESSGEAYAYPVYETVFLKYTITDENGKLVADENGSYAYMADNTGLDDIIEKTLLTNNDITVTLYSDVKTTKPASITVGANTVRFDLNGYSYYMTSNYKSTLFSIAQGAKLYIYSSQPGGEILSSSYVNKALSTGYLCSGSYAKQYVQLGAYDADGDGKKEIPGDNLGIHMGVLVDFTHSTGTVSDADRNEVIIDGGIYTRTRDAGGFFVVRNQNTYIEFKNATYYDYSGAFIFTGDSGTYANCKTTAIIDNSKIYCSAGLFSFGTNVGSTITFTNSVIYGSLTNANTGNPQDPSRVIIGEGNTLTQDIKTLGTAVTLAENCEYYTPLNNEYTAKISMYKFIYNATDVADVYELDWNSYTNKIENTVTATITAITASADPDKLITLNMIDQEGKPIGTTYFPAGTAPSVTAVPEIDLDNPFFNIGFDKWVDENGNEFDFAACEAGKTYTAKATMKIVADFDGAFMNVVASIKFQPYVFVPVPDPEGYDGYEVVLGKTTAKITHYNGQAYYSFDIASYPTPTDTGSAVSFTMDYTVNGVPLSATVRTYDLPTYFEKAAELSDESGKKLIIAVVNFCNEAHRIAKNSTYARYDALLEKYAGLVPKIETYNADIAEDADRIDFSKLAPYVNASYATTSSMMPFFALSPANGVAIYPNLSEGTQYYIYTGGENVSYSVEQFKGDSKYSVSLYENAATYADPYGNGNFGQRYGTQISGGSFLYQFSTNVPAYLLGNDMEITVRILPASAITVTEDGDKKTAAIDTEAAEYIKGTYNLATYIEGLRAIAEPTVAEQNALEFAEALYMYYALAVEFQTTAEGN